MIWFLLILRVRIEPGMYHRTTTSEDPEAALSLLQRSDIRARFGSPVRSRPPHHTYPALRHVSTNRASRDARGVGALTSSPGFAKMPHV